MRGFELWHIERFEKVRAALQYFLKKGDPYPVQDLFTVNVTEIPSAWGLYVDSIRVELPYEGHIHFTHIVRGINDDGYFDSPAEDMLYTGDTPANLIYGLQIPWIGKDEESSGILEIQVALNNNFSCYVSREEPPLYELMKEILPYIKPVISALHVTFSYGTTSLYLNVGLLLNLPGDIRFPGVELYPNMLKKEREGTVSIKRPPAAETKLEKIKMKLKHLLAELEDKEEKEDI